MENSIKKFYYTKSWLINTDSHDIPELSLWKSSFEELFLELDKNHKDSRKDHSCIVYLTLPENIVCNQLNAFDFSVCLVGGLGKVNFQKQLEIAKKLNIDFFISDIAHQEIKSFLDSENYNYFRNNYALAPLSSANENKYSNENKYLSKLITHSEFASSVDKNIHHALTTLETVEYVDLNLINPEDWLIESIPEENNNIVIVDHPFSSLNSIIAKYCSNECKSYINLGTKGVLSKSRIQFQFSNDCYKDFSNTSKSIRSRINEIIKRINEKPNRDKFSYSHSRSILKILSEINCDDVKNTKIKQNKTEILIFKEKPFEFLYAHLENDFGLDQLNKRIQSNNSLPVEFVNWVYETNLKNLLKLEGYNALLCTKKIIEGNTENYIHALNLIHNRNNDQIFLTKISSLIQFSFQFHATDQIELESMFRFLIGINPDLRTKLSLLFSLKEYDLFNKIYTLESSNSNERGIIGQAVYLFMLQTQILNSIDDQDFTFFRELLRREKEIGKDNISTYNSLALIDILQNKNSVNIDYILSPKQDKNYFLYDNVFFNHISVLLTFFNNSSLALKCLEIQKKPNLAFSIERSLGVIALSILNSSFDDAEKYATQTKDEISNKITKISDLWHYSNQPYFISFYLSVIFKFNEMINSSLLCQRLMENSSCGWSDVCNSLLTKTKSCEGNFNSISKILKSLERFLDGVEF